ncbi:acyltransferase [uncultured Methylobacterium sp.]|uniref:acyltransferase family protein n=1 Tax=uncultured Methylobacterium sp. TaxID=157278 RepID=UPI002630DA74|nr:acyltransferase [uncultured Methylobacterium sp.]
MSRPSKLPLIQVLRAVAALMVVVSHGQAEAAALAARFGLAFRPAGWLPWPAGVDVFFVISGFIIVHAAGPLHGQPAGPRRFLAHRIARVVPLYWLVTSLYLALALARPGMLNAPGGADPGLVAASYLFWPMARPDGAVTPLYSLGWTLNYEMAFYAVFALALPWPRRRAVAAVAAGLVALVVATRLVGGLPTPLAFWGDPIVLEFAVGLGLGLLRAEGLHLPGAVRAALAAGGLALLALAGDTTLPRALAWGGPAALLVAAAALGRREPEGRLVRAASHLGDASYALYLVHPFVVRAVGVAGAVGPGLPLLVAAMIGLSCAVALAVHRLVERPLDRALRRRLDPPGR